jgi:hypothetical protein
VDKLMNFGIATAAKTPMMTMVMISSISVKPLWAHFPTFVYMLTLPVVNKRTW